MKHAGQHVGLAGVEVAAGARLGDDPLEVVRSATLRLGGRICAEHPQHRVGGPVQDNDQGREQPSEEAQRPGDPSRQSLRVLNRVELRNDLADDALAAGDQQIGDRHRDGHGRRMADGVSERSLEQVRDRRFAERADGDRGHRDPNLAGRDVVADLLELLEGEARAARALLGKRLQPSPPRAHERVLRDHEERVDQDKQPGHDDQERRHGPFSALGPSPALCVLRLLLRGGSSSVIQRPAER